MVQQHRRNVARGQPSMKVPPKRKGNPPSVGGGTGVFFPSMKVPPKRKGNSRQGPTGRFS